MTEKQLQSRPWQTEDFNMDMAPRHRSHLAERLADQHLMQFDVNTQAAASPAQPAEGSALPATPPTKLTPLPQEDYNVVANAVNAVDDDPDAPADPLGLKAKKAAQQGHMEAPLAPPAPVQPQAVPAAVMPPQAANMAVAPVNTILQGEQQQAPPPQVGYQQPAPPAAPVAYPTQATARPQTAQPAPMYQPQPQAPQAPSASLPAQAFPSVPAPSLTSSYPQQQQPSYGQGAAMQQLQPQMLAQFATAMPASNALNPFLGSWMAANTPHFAAPQMPLAPMHFGPQLGMGMGMGLGGGLPSSYPAPPSSNRGFPLINTFGEAPRPLTQNFGAMATYPPRLPATGSMEFEERTGVF
jgi:hypothetical protein